MVLLNSHGHNPAYRVLSGGFRTDCENDMVIRSADFGSFSIRHSGSCDLFRQFREATAQIMDGVAAVMNRIEAWKETILPRSRQIGFARDAWTLKLNPTLPASRLLNTRRDEDMTLPDASRDPWRATDVIQESLVRGGLTGRDERGRRARTRPVKAADADLRINRRLWGLAEALSLN